MKNSFVQILVVTFVTALALFNRFASASLAYSPIVISLPSFTKDCLYHDLNSDDDSLVVSYQVLTGGNFEIDFDITAPDGSTIISEKQKKYSDFVLKSFGSGQYIFCFSNSYGTALKKIEITLEPEKSLESLDKSGESGPEEIIANNAIEEIDRNLRKITKLMNYLRAREWRNQSTVESTESRVFWLSLGIMFLMVGVSVLQTLVVQFFFKDRQRAYV
ncbi:Protein erp4 [Hanseniaspora vineae]